MYSVANHAAQQARGKSFLELWDIHPLSLFDLFQNRMSMLLEHMHKKFEMNQIKIKGGCQSVRKVIPNKSKSDLPLDIFVL